MMNNNYNPVSCEYHSELELAIMRRNLLDVTWHDDHNECQTSILNPTDLITEQQAEYLLATNVQNEDIKIRLDHIDSLSSVR